mgnify:CR=1 FL=1
MTTQKEELENFDQYAEDGMEQKVDKEMGQLKLEDTDKNLRIRDLLDKLSDAEITKERYKAFKESKIDSSKIKNYLSSKYNATLG